MEMRHYIDIVLNESEKMFDNDALKQRYNHFNRLCFEGKLPDIPIEYAPLKSVGGHVVAAVKKTRMDGKVIGEELVPDSIRLQISSTFKKEQADIDGILLHEMIHVWFIAVLNNLREQHGIRFMAKLRDVAAKSGIDIPLTEKTIGLEPTEAPTRKVGAILLTKTTGETTAALVSESYMRENLEAMKKRWEYFVKMDYVKEAKFAITHGKIELTFPIQRKKLADLKFYFVRDSSMLKELRDNSEMLAVITKQDVS